jgi:SAM-dependent methyltransferase
MVSSHAAESIAALPDVAAAPLGPSLAACPLCGGTAAVPSSARGVDLARCGACGLLRADPQPDAAALDAIYTAGYFLGDDTPEGRARLRGLKRASAERYLAELARYRGTHGGRLLEIGCGTGDFLAVAREAGYDVTGVEVSEAAAAEARGRVAGAEVVAGELAEAGLTPGTFDVCVLWDVLEHARDPVDLLRAVHALLRPGGVVALATPSLDSWSARLLGRRWMEFKTEHLFYFDRGTLEGTLARSGFEALVIAPGWKVLSLDYVARHFERFRVPLLSPLLRAARGLLPSALRDRPLPVVASGVLAFGRRAEVRARPRVSVVVPAYNEGATFETLMARLLAKEVPGLDLEVVVVESGSSDGTREQAVAAASHPRVTLVQQERPLGKGNAVRAGLARATGDFVLIQDADLEYDLDDYDKLLAPLVAYRRALVLGSRHGGGTLSIRRFTDQAALSLLLNAGHWLFAALVNVLFLQRLRDPFTMYKVFRRDCLTGLAFRCDRFDFDIELLVLLLRKGYRPLEIPVSYRSRSFREGKKVSIWRDPWTWLRVMARLRFTRVDPLAQVARERTRGGSRS